jgi:NDP-sugar pyrophosphorylase family protein
VDAVIKAKGLIKDDEPCIVNYCDFSMQRDYKDFVKTVAQNKCDGAIPSYIGFHPHLSHQHKYAGMRTDEKNWMLEIREKHSFTENTMDSYQSVGTYYFASGTILKKYCQKMLDE